MYTHLTLSQLIKDDFSIGIIGLGVENKRFLNWLLEVVKLDPKRIYLADRMEPTLEFDISVFGGVFFGNSYLEICNQNIKHIFKAPGVWSLLPEFEEFRKTHGQNSIHSSLIFFFERFREQILGITGTKGKSTTSSLITYILNTAAFKEEYREANGAEPWVIYTGNSTNTSPYDHWQNIEQTSDLHKYFVIELSSFQLQDLAFDTISPRRAVITNYYIDHQDQHRSVAEYWNAKNTIFKFQEKSDFMIASDQIKEKISNLEPIQNILWVDEEITEKLTKTVSHRLIGKHNNLNISLAVIASLSLIEKDNLVEKTQEFLTRHPLIIDSFVPLRHRLEVVAKKTAAIQLTLNSKIKTLPLILTGINDAQGTMPEATISGIKALTQQDQDFLWLIISGKDKGVEIDGLCEQILHTQINHKLFRTDYYGEIGNRVLNGIYQKMGSPSLQQATDEKLRISFPEDINPIDKVVREFQNWLQSNIVEAEEIGNDSLITQIDSLAEIRLFIGLLPCGASFDEFVNYQEKGDWFAQIMREAFINE